MPPFVASDLVMYCLLMRHKKDARLKLVKGCWDVFFYCFLLVDVPFQNSYSYISVRFGVNDTRIKVLFYNDYRIKSNAFNT